MATKKKMLQAAAGNAVGGAGGPLNVEDVFSTYLYTGNGATQTITNGIDLDGEGGLVWIKERVDTTRHLLFDTERGVYKYISSNRTDGEASSSSSLTNFNSDGFSIDTNGMLNDNTKDFASWTFRKAPKFFDVVTWTGDGTDARQISHSLGATVGSIFVKNTSSGSTEWMVYHRSLSNDLPNHSLSLVLNQTYDQLSWKAFGEHSTQTSSVFTLGTNSPNEFFVNQSGQTYVAYLFAHNDGDGEFGADGDADIIKCGSYVSNETSPPEITLGFEPQWILIKKSTGADEWAIFDNMRGVPTDGNDAMLRPNLTNAEYDAANQIDFTSTGFKLTTAGLGVTNAPTGETYIYIAIRRGTKVPESATEVFAIDTGTGTIPTYVSGFPVDMSINKQPSAVVDNRMGTRLTGNNRLVTNSTAAQATDNAFVYDYMDGWAESYANSTHQSWMWKRAPGYFDVVAYTATGSSSLTLNHNLGVVPEMMWVKRRSGTSSWKVYHKDLTNTNSFLYINSTAAENSSQSNVWPTAPTATQLTIGNYTGDYTGGGDTGIAYLFASLPGISKVGSYAGNGGTQTIDCGFTTGARWILIKRTDGNSNWYIWDTERGINVASDPYLQLNKTDAENPGQDEIDAHASGFIINNPGGSGDAEINKSGRTYIFYAIA